MSKQKSTRPSKKSTATRRSAPTGVTNSASTNSKTETTSVNGSVKEKPLTGSNGTSDLSGAEKTSSATTSVATKQLASTGAGAKTPLPASKTLHKGAAKYERRQVERQQRMAAQRRAARTKTFVIFSVCLVVVLVGSLITFFAYRSTHGAQGTSASSSTFTEPIYDSDFQPIDNIYCDALEGSVLHIHIHLSIYIDGQPSAVPQYIGIPVDQQSGQSTCFYWLHTHDTSGVVHIESPVSTTFSLGQFLQVWNRGFNTLGFPSQLLLNTGWTVYVNGNAYKSDFNSIPLAAHSLITMGYNSPNMKPDTTYAWNGL